MSASAEPVVVAFDGSAPSRDAIAAAAGLLVSRRLVILTVWEPALAYALTAEAPDVGMPAAVPPSVTLELDESLREHSERVARTGVEIAQSLGFEAEPVAVPDAGGIGRTILQVADERGAAAIVVGSRGLGGLRARLEGSTSRSVLKDASCPVLVVHGHAADDAES
jgi:nucleotide-binding universal stress UspA family protein